MKSFWWWYWLSFLYVTSGYTILSKDSLPFYYPIGTHETLKKHPIQKLQLFGQPLVCYHSQQNQSFIIHSDICPHQGASLSKGWINEFGNLQCPYHGFEFCSGMFCKIPNPIKSPPQFKSKTVLPVFPCKTVNNMVFLSPVSAECPSLGEPYFPPEEYDEEFRSIEGSRVISQNVMSVCENLLDMLHISYVHSFGNSFSPLPHSIRYSNLSDTSGRSEFIYTPKDFTISGKIGRVSKVIVHNEFYLPTTTLTRVIAGPVVKTVFTRSLPLSRNKTLLFWKVYRNFWIDPYVDVFSGIGDSFMSFLMDRTIDEDVDMLRHVYSKYRVGTLKTKYDVTIENFRAKTKEATQRGFVIPEHCTQKVLQPFHDYDI